MESENIFITIFISFLSMIMYDQYQEYKKKQKIDSVVNTFWSGYTVFVSAFGTCYLIEKLKDNNLDMDNNFRNISNKLTSISESFQRISNSLNSNVNNNNENDNED